MSADSEYKPKNEERTGTADASLYVNAESGVDAAREDREADKSESTGRIPQSEINDLRANAGDQTTKSRTRGMKNDAMRQEREVDEAIDSMPEDRI